jgi:ribosomal protein L7/L12
MTKKEEAVFVEAFDELEAEGFFNDLREKARARKLQEKAQVGFLPAIADCEDDIAVYAGLTKALIACMEEPEDFKKLSVINEVRAITGLGFKEAKDLIEGVSKIPKKDVSEEIVASFMLTYKREIS